MALSVYTGDFIEVLNDSLLDMGVFPQERLTEVSMRATTVDHDLRKYEMLVTRVLRRRQHVGHKTMSPEPP